MLLAGDIGGTKTQLALYLLEATPVYQQDAIFKSADYPSLEAIVQEFLAQTGVTVNRAVFGVAGPVVNGASKITNLPWHITESNLNQTLQLPLAAVKLLNFADLLSRIPVYVILHENPGLLGAAYYGRS